MTARPRHLILKGKMWRNSEVSRQDKEGKCLTKEEPAATQVSKRKRRNNATNRPKRNTQKMHNDNQPSSHQHARYIVDSNFLRSVSRVQNSVPNAFGSGRFTLCLRVAIKNNPPRSSIIDLFCSVGRPFSSSISSSSSSTGLLRNSSC